MSTRDLIDAIATGDSLGIEKAFESAMASRIVDRLDAMRQNVAKNMFNEAACKTRMKQEEMDDEEKEDEESLDEAMKQVHPDALHVEPVGKNKYKVHAVGKNFSDGIKAGEHLSDTELDDFHEMGGKIKHVKPAAK